jgi:hypothetical protein
MNVKGEIKPDNNRILGKKIKFITKNVIGEIKSDRY